MATVCMNKMDRSSRLPQESRASSLIQTRLQNISKKFMGTMHSLSEDKLQSLLVLPDEELWSEVKYQALTQMIIESKTPEKTEQEEYAEARQDFLRDLEKYGGVHKSSTVMKLLSLTTPTIISYGKKNKLIVLNWGVENLFPVFQFSNDKKLSERGMLKGVPELLSNITHDVSAVRKCNFFTRKIEIPGATEKTSALEILRRGATKEEMKYLCVLADNFGTNSAV